MRRLLEKAQLDLQEVDLNRAIDDAVDFVSVQASESDVDLKTVLAPEVLSVRCDPIQLQQVVLNLVLNSIDAIRVEAKGERRVTASVDQRTTAEVAITDTGPGIPRDVLKTIFDPFHTTKANRLGMALTIARTIIESHGGSTRAVNQRDRGAAFNITLPLARAGTR